MSGDVTIGALQRQTWLPDRDAGDNGLLIAGQYYYDVYFTGGDISGVTLSLLSPLAISSGGTGQITANAALNALLPSQGGNSGKSLQTDGTNASWVLGGTGTVTSFSAGNLSPLFTTSVATSTTTPALTFALSNAAATTYFGSIAGGAPSYVTGGSLTKTDDTNVTMTLGGSATNALLSTGVSMTLGWTGILASSRGGTGNGFTKFSGPTTSEKTFTLPDATTTILTTNAAVTPAQGGTGIQSYAIGDLLYASGATTLSKLADVAAGSYLRSGGVTTAPVWSTTTLPNSATTGDILYASGSNTYANLADIATGNALISGGVGVAPSWGKIALTTHVSGVLPVANGGTNASSASITAFNNITGYTASGATGTTSTNLVFSALPSFSKTIGVGAATASASGSGISFPAALDASTDANTLDDYEEGTTTPTTTSSGGSITTQSTTIHYTKVGRRVFLDCTITITNNGTGTGRLLVPLPFANGGLNAAGGGFNTSTANLVSGFIATGGSTMEVYKYDATYPVATGQALAVSAAYDIS